MKEAIFKMTLDFTTTQPAWATAAPANPPINVWEELEGMPRYHGQQIP